MARPLFLPEDIFLNLAGGRLREISELHVFGSLEPGDTFLSERDYAFSSYFLALADHNERLSLIHI